MRTNIIITMALAFIAIVGLSTTVAAQQTLSERVKGQVLLSVEEHGELWYVHPQTGKRKHLRNATHTWEVIREQMVGVTDATLHDIPREASKEANPLRDRLKGTFLLAVESRGEVWYVNPHDGLRYYLGTGEHTFDRLKFLALGIRKADLEEIALEPDLVIPTKEEAVLTDTNFTPVDDRADAQSNMSFDLAMILESLDQVEFTDGGLAWEFASSYWRGATEYYKDHGHFISLKWFENVFPNHKPIYLNEAGFTLSSGNRNYWAWSTFTPEFFKMYYEHVRLIQEKDDVYLQFNLPEAVNTHEYGKLAPGPYYFSLRDGLLTAEEFARRHDRGYFFAKQGIDLDTEAEHIIATVKSLQKGLNQFFNDNGGYPELLEHKVKVGENGFNRLTRNHGFFPADDAGKVYVDNIQPGGPTTDIVYDSVLAGRSYKMSFTLYGETDEFSPGIYEATPYRVRKVAELPR